MKPINWNSEKNRKLIQERNISFENVVFCLQNEAVLDDMVHPNQDKYPHQRIFVVAIDEYAYLVPYIETDDKIFLKIIIPSRKATKQYMR